MRMFRKKSVQAQEISDFTGLPVSKILRLPALVLQYKYYPGTAGLGISLTECLAPVDQMVEMAPGGLKEHIEMCLSNKVYLTEQTVNIDIIFKLVKEEELAKLRRKWKAEKVAIKLAFDVLGLDRMKELNEKGFIKIRACDGRVYFLTLHGIFDHKWKNICTMYRFNGMDVGNCGYPEHDLLVFNFIVLHTHMREISSPFEDSRLRYLFHPEEIKSEKAAAREDLLEIIEGTNPPRDALLDAIMEE